MRKQLRQVVAVLGSKGVLLFVLIFSTLVVAVSGYRFSNRSSAVSMALAKLDGWVAYGDKFRNFGMYAQVAASNASYYAIAGNPQFLSRSSTAIDSLEVIYRQFKEGHLPEPASINPQLLATFEQMSAQEMDRLQHMRSRHDTGGHPGADRLAATDAGIGLADSLIQSSGQITREIRITIDKLKAGIVVESNRNFFMVDAGIIAVVLLMALVFFILLKTITRHQKAGEELRWQRTYFNTTLDSIGDGLISTDGEGRIVFMNPAAEMITGLGVQEVYKTPIQKVLNLARVGTAPTVQHMTNDFLPGGPKATLENNARQTAQDAGSRKIKNEGPLPVLTNGRTREEVLFFNIVPEKKGHEMELKKSREHLQRIMDMSLDMIFTVSETGTIFSVNAASGKILGYTPTEMIGRNIFEFVFEEDRIKTIQKVDEINKGARVNDFENRYQHKNGSLISLLWSARWDENTQLRYAIARDITERQKEQDALGESEKKYRNLVEQASDAIILFSLDGTIHEFNSVVSEITGYSKEECAVLKLSDLLRDKLIANYGKTRRLLRGQSVTVNRQIIRQDGSLFDMEIRIKMLENGLILGLGRDITERRKTEQLLLDSENHLRTIYDTEPECIKLVGPNQELIEMNPAGLAMIEADNLDMVKGKRMTSIVLPKYREAFDVLTQKVFDGHSGKLTFEMIGLKGTHRWLETHAVPLRNAEKKIIALLSVTRDITEKKKDEERILKEKDLLESVINHLPGVFYLLNEKLQFLRWNKNFEAVTGYNGDEIAEMHLIDFFDIDDKKSIAEKINELFVKGHVSTEAHYLTKKGKKIPYHLVSYKLDMSGNIQLLGAGYDISERKKSEVITRSAIERYDILAQATSDTIWDWNIVTNSIAYNKGINKMFGYKAVDVENVVTWWNDKLHPEDIEQVRESLVEIFDKKQQRIQLNYRFRCADGTYKHIFDRAFVIFDENGTPKRMIGAMQDVTFKVLEESRIAKAIIDAQEQERNYLGAELHDNVNQILAGSLLNLSIAKSVKMDTHKVVSLIETTMTYIREAIDETRRLSHHLAPASFEYTSLKNSIQTLLFNINIDHRYQIDFRFLEFNKTETPEKVKINLYRILQEQVKNIDKYSYAAQIEVEVAVYDHLVRMRTADNGQGFNVKHAKKGIGLDNMKRRVESFSGKFTLNSVPGRGCEIMVEIPTGAKTSTEDS